MRRLQITITPALTRSMLFAEIHTAEQAGNIEGAARARRQLSTTTEANRLRRKERE